MLMDCLHAAIAIGALQCLWICFACCFCHRGLQMLLDLFCMLLLPSGFCRCLFGSFFMLLLPLGFADACYFVRHAALAIGALQMPVSLFFML